MNTPINLTFTISDMVGGLISVLGMVAFIYLIMTLREIFSILKGMNEFYKDNSKEIKVIVEDGSQIIHKVGAISKSIPDEPVEIFNDFKENFSGIQSLITLIFNMFAKRK